MTQMYEGSCEECGREHRFQPDLPDGLLLEDGSFAKVGDRLPRVIPKMYGHSRKWFWWQARYVRRRRRFCSNCGGRYEAREIGAPREYGLVTGLLASGLAGTLVGAGAESAWGGFNAFLLTAIVLLWTIPRIATAIARLRARQLNRSIDDLPCCAAPTPVKPRQLKRGKFRCRDCDQVALSFTEQHYRTSGPGTRRPESGE